MKKCCISFCDANTINSDIYCGMHRRSINKWKCIKEFYESTGIRKKEEYKKWLRWKWYYLIPVGWIKSKWYYCIVDIAFSYLEKYTWSNSKWYATTIIDKTSCMMYHVIAWKPINWMVVDHINWKRFDNRTKNLRIVTPSENSKNVEWSALRSEFEFKHYEIPMIA